VISQFHPAADAEFEAAILDGVKYGKALALRLRIETARVVDLLCDTPNIGQPASQGCRRFPLSGFPFAIVYFVDGDVLSIVAFAHKRRRPGYWRRRK
jgi:toxin ParE1/3/4